MDKRLDSITRKNSLIFLKSIFLTDPVNDEQGYIDKIEKNYFIVKCPRTQWKISFKMEEV